jgi:hypothetical protein
VSDAWNKLPLKKRRELQASAEDLVRGSIIEGAAARFLAMVICEAAEAARENERGKWMDAIGEYFDGPTAEAVRSYVEDRGTKMEMQHD